MRRLHRAIAALLVQLGWNESAHHLSTPHAWLLPSGRLRAGRRSPRDEASPREVASPVQTLPRRPESDV